MDAALIIARLIHVGAGVFWAGTMFVTARFLLPALGDIGPDGMKFISALDRRGYTTAIPAAAVLTVLAGIFLLWRTSSGFNPVYMRSGPGMTYSIGGLSAIIALAIGASIVRGSMMKVLALHASSGSASESDRARISQEMMAYRAKVVTGTRIVALLLVITVTCMAIGRYV